MKLNDIINAASICLPYLKSVHHHLIIDQAVSSDTEIQGIKIKTTNNITGHALSKTETPDNVFAIKLDFNSKVKGIKGKANVNIRSSLILSLNQYEEIHKLEESHKLDKFLDLVFMDFANMQRTMLYQSDLKIKAPGSTYERLLGNQVYGSKLLIPCKINLEGLSELEISVLEASARICLSSLDNLTHIFRDLYFPYLKHQNVA